MSKIFITLHHQSGKNFTADIPIVKTTVKTTLCCWLVAESLLPPCCHVANLGNIPATNLQQVSNKTAFKYLEKAYLVVVTQVI